MKKNRRFYLGMLLVSIMLCFGAPARAQLVAGVSFDFLGDAAAAITPVFEQIQTGLDEAVKFAKEKVTKIKAKVASYFTKRNNAAEKVPGTKGFAEDSSVDIYDPVAVQAAVNELFLQYPSNDARVNKYYEKEAVEFYYDTMIEAQTAAKKLEGQLNSLRTDIDNFSKDAIAPSGGNAGSSDSSDENGNYYNLYLAHKKFNDVLKVTEEVMALYAQYYVARVIYRRIILPAPYEEEGEEGGALKTSSASSIFRSNMAFAQFLTSSPAVAAKTATTARSTATLSTASRSPAVQAADAVTTARSTATLSTASRSPAVQAADAVTTARSTATLSTASRSLAVQAADAVTTAQTVSARAVGGVKAISAASPATDEEKEAKASLFAVPEAPEAKSTLAGSEKELEALGKISEAQKYLNKAIDAHNAIRLMPTYRNIFKQYEMFQQMHAKASEAVAKSDQCVVQYLGRRYARPETVWYGSQNAPQDPTAYDERTGLSGWAVAAFQVANADKSAGLNTDSFAVMDYGVKVDSSNLAEADKLTAQIAATDDSKALASPSQEEEFSAASREVELIVWQIGAEAAKILAADQYSDNPVYGRAENPYPLWQDQKSFYNQYIDGKYENMQTYIRNLDLTEVALQIAELINDNREDGTTKSATQRGLQRLSSYIAQRGSQNGDGGALVREKQAALDKVSAAEASALAPYQENREKLMAELDDVAAVISSLNDEISVADSETAEANAKVESAYSNMQLMNRRNTAEGSTMYAMHQNDLTAGREEASASMTRANALHADVKKYEARRDELNGQIAELDKKIAAVKEDYLNRKAVTEGEYEAKLQQAGSGDDEPTLAGLASELGVNSIGLSSVVSQADGMVSDAKSYAIRLIDEARADLYALGDGLYDAKNSGVVVKRHAELIEDMQKMPTEQFIRSAALAIGAGGATSVASLLSGALASAIGGTVCGNVSCNEPDSEYFVGAVAKVRDFSAPKIPEFEHYPTPRDVVHFDATDYKNINKTADGIVTRESFLEYGGEIPSIWRQMLANDAFVEKGLNLTSLLEQGGESIYFMRGTLYPCRLGNYTVDVAASKIDVEQTSGQYLVSQGAARKQPTCGDISLRGSLYYTVTDLELDKSVSAGRQQAPQVVSPSELGTLLEYSGQRLRFNPTAYNVYERMLELEEKANSDETFDYEVRDNVYQKSMYANNQIGNFLHFVDKENSIRKNVDELKLSIDDARESISEMLSEMGFDLAADFNLANDEEYAYIRNKLIEYKNNLIGRAASEISGISNTNEVVKERYDKVENTRAALVQDKDALVNLNNSTQAGSSLSEAIISERANQEVMEKTQDEGLSAIREEIDNYEKPLCVAY